MSFLTLKPGVLALRRRLLVAGSQRHQLPQYLGHQWTEALRCAGESLTLCCLGAKPKKTTPHKGQGVGCARAFWGRKYTLMVLGQGRKYTRMVLARVTRVTASSVHAVRGLICTRGQGPRLCTRNGFAVCTPLFLQLCILCAPCVQVVRYRSLAVLPLCILCAPCVQVVRFITMLFGHV